MRARGTRQSGSPRGLAAIFWGTDRDLGFWERFRGFVGVKVIPKVVAGKKITGKTARTFKPNIQKIRVVVNGRVVRMKVAAKFIRRGMVIKPPIKRKVAS